MEKGNKLIESDGLILVTGAGGFIGKRVVATLLEHGFTHIRCLVRPPYISDQIRRKLGVEVSDSRVEVVEGNLLSRKDCDKISKGVQVIYHLAAGRGEKSYPSAYLNSVVTTRNLLDGSLQQGCLKRFVNVSSFAVYTNQNKPCGRVLDERCPLERNPVSRGSPYCFAKLKQEELIIDYQRKYGVPFVIVRPGVVYGPGNEQIHGRVGIDTFGIFLHMGGSNEIPLTYVENCADAIILAGTANGIEGEVFNVVDDDLPSSREFLRLYKEHVSRFPTVYVPHIVSYLLCYLWEKYSEWSKGQLPNAFNRKDWHVTWKKTFYTNEKLKRRLGWRQRVPTSIGLREYFKSCREKSQHA